MALHFLACWWHSGDSMFVRISPIWQENSYYVFIFVRAHDHWTTYKWKRLGIIFNGGLGYYLDTYLVAVDFPRVLIPVRLRGKLQLFRKTQIKGMNVYWVCVTGLSIVTSFGDLLEYVSKWNPPTLRPIKLAQNLSNLIQIDPLPNPNLVRKLNSSWKLS